MSNTLSIPDYQTEKEELRKSFPQVLPMDSLKVWDAESEKMGTEFIAPMKVEAGDNAPLFELPNALGAPIALRDLLKKGVVVLTFYRGGWCPYCNLVLNAYQRILPQINSYGASLVAISPQTPDNSLDTKEKGALRFEVLSDKDNEVAKQYVHVFVNSEAYTAESRKYGVDIRVVNDTETEEVPVPAVFIIDQSGKIIFAKSEGGDYRKRVEPRDILEALAKM